VLIPESPYNLLQEIYIEDPWKILVCCIFLNQTKRAQVDTIREEFFSRWSSALSLCESDPEKVRSLIRSLGFYNRRTLILIKFSKAWMQDWKSPKELPGIGKYAMDSWKIFVEGQIVEDPTDHVLNDYVLWRRTNSF
jgi:endonuclease III